MHTPNNNIQSPSVNPSQPAAIPQGGSEPSTALPATKANETVVPAKKL